MMYARDFRASARAALRGKWVTACLVGLIACLLGAGTLAYGSGSVSSGVRTGMDEGYVDPSMGLLNDPSYNSNSSAQYYNNFEMFQQVFVGIVFILVLFYAFIMLVIGSAVDIGYKRYHLAVMDGENPGIGILFSGFSIYGKAVLLRVLTALYFFLWYLLFIIPGIVKMYSYAMAPYILAENPDMQANDAITASRNLMYGNKWRLFCLDMSFIGWSLLASLSCGLGCIPLEAYMSSARAAFYREISRTWKAQVDYDSDFIK